jgi:hypothetical protein
MQNYYDNYDNYDNYDDYDNYGLGPNEFGDELALKELISNMVTTRYTLSPDYTLNSEKSSRFFFVMLLTIFIVVSSSGQMMAWFRMIPHEISLMDKFLDEIYGYSNDDEILFGESVLEDVSPVIKRYEEKYVDETAQMVCKKLSPELLEALTNNYVMENTPNGNVMMRYNSVKESFEYYSDNIVPNRFLDVVARKFVKTYDCVMLYKSLSMIQEEDSLVTEPITASTNNVSVFAKFKTYNNPKAPAQKRDIKRDVKTSRPVISSNRYTSCGKMANMQMLKKVDRKVVDKSYAMSFAEYKLLRTDK